MRNPQKKLINTSKEPRQSCPTITQKSPPQALSADMPIHDFAQVNYLTVTTHQEGQRLDNFLLARLKGLPRSHVYKMLRDDEIRINKKRAKAHTRLAVNDVVRIAPVRLVSNAPLVIGSDLQASLLRAIIYEDDGLIVLNKPHGLAVHGGSGTSAGVIEIMRKATAKPYLELVHRIDKGTSGLLMIAKKRSVLKNLQAALREQRLQKTYLCAVDGVLQCQSLTDKGVNVLSATSAIIDKPLLKYTLVSGERRVKVAMDGKPSVTKIAVVGQGKLSDKPITLVKAMPKTGRTHQIRVHLAAIGHPLLGDDKYNNSDTNAHRLYLHAWQLVVEGYPPFVAPLPDSLQTLLDNSQIR